MSTIQFPLTVADGNSRVKIYRYTKGDYLEFKVVFFEAGRRKMQSFAKYEEAKAKADSINVLVNAGENGELTFSQAEFRQFRRIKDMLADTGLTPEAAMLQFTEATRSLGNASLLEAVEFFKTNHRDLITIGIGSAVNEYLDSKIRRGVTADWLKCLTPLMRRFQAAFNCNLDSVKSANIAAFLTRPSERSCKRRHIDKYCAETHNNYRKWLLDFFKFCIRRKWLPLDWGEMNEIEVRTIPPGRIEIYSPREIYDLLEACRGTKRTWRSLQSYIAVAAFTGLRSQEILRLNWRDVGVGTKGNYIEVRAENAKTRQRRLVPIAENLIDWLPANRSAGPVWPWCKGHMIYCVRELCKDLGFRWKRNALRHSYISYRVAQTADVGKVALEAGNSPAIIFRHYRELVTPETAADWFGVRPGLLPGEASDKILSINSL